MYIQHAIHTMNRIMSTSCMLDSVNVQTAAALHVVLLTFVPGVFSPFSPRPAPLSSRCEVGHQFRPDDPAIFPPAATYMLPRLIYPCECYP